MKLGMCSAINFGSYKELDFNFQDLGLTLISGPTASGKSTLMDLAAWTLFGVTAKGGSVDEVRNWSNLDECTKSTLTIEAITITRIRGGSQQNDLYWVEVDSDIKKRGKDLGDTQKQLNQRLGFDSDTYLAAAYFHEFNPTTHFFIAKAKERRELFEKISDQAFPALIAEKAAGNKKETKAELVKAQMEEHAAKTNLDQIINTKVGTEKKRLSWEKDRETSVAALHDKHATFETQKSINIKTLSDKVLKWNKERSASLAQFDSEQGLKVSVAVLKLSLKDTELEIKEAKVCPTCGNICSSKLEAVRYELKDQITSKLSELKNVQTLKSQQNPYVEQLQVVKDSINNYSEQIESLSSSKNPFDTSIEEYNAQIVSFKESIASLTKKVQDFKHRLDSLQQVYDLSFELRALLLTKAVKSIQTKTNYYLDKYFDAEIRIMLSANSADNIDLSIYKSGHDCSYTMLSKGQRGLLKLCFTTAIMLATANQSGIHFDTLFFDEALDGLDAEFKVRAFGLFSELGSSHDSVLVIEHSNEFKTLFDKKYTAELAGDFSELKEDI